MSGIQWQMEGIGGLCVGWYFQKYIKNLCLDLDACLYRGKAKQMQLTFRSLLQLE
jgi:hypothetical protein